MPRFDSADPSGDHSAAVKVRMGWATDEERRALALAYPLEWDEWSGQCRVCGDDADRHPTPDCAWACLPGCDCDASQEGFAR